MEVLKWIGYTIATLIALAVVAGGGFLIAVIVTIGGTLGFLALLVVFCGLLFEELMGRVFQRARRK